MRLSISRLNRYPITTALKYRHNRVSQKLNFLVVTPLPIYSGMDTTGHVTSPSIIASVEKYANEVAEKVMGKATQICKDFNDQITVETMVEHGDPRDVICDVAERFRVDFLVVGSHGYGIIKRAFLGSVSSHCAQNVKCPVLIVKKPNSDNADH